MSGTWGGGDVLEKSRNYIFFCEMNLKLSDLGRKNFYEWDEKKN